MLSFENERTPGIMCAPTWFIDIRSSRKPSSSFLPMATGVACGARDVQHTPGESRVEKCRDVARRQGCFARIKYKNAGGAGAHLLEWDGAQALPFHGSEVVPPAHRPGLRSSAPTQIG